MITKAVAIALPRHTTLYHATMRNADGTAVRCRLNGACKTWVTRPDDFRLPVKHGLRNCFYVTLSNAADWLLEDPTAGTSRAAQQAVGILPTRE